MPSDWGSMKRILRRLFAEEWNDFLWNVWAKDLYSRIDTIEKTYRTAKEMVMQRKLQELGYDVKNVFPKPKFMVDGEIPLEEMPTHPTGFFEVTPRIKNA